MVCRDSEEPGRSGGVLPDEVQRRWMSGCNYHYKFVQGAGAKVEDPPIGGDEPNEVSPAQPADRKELTEGNPGPDRAKTVI